MTYTLTLETFNISCVSSRVKLTLIFAKTGCFRTSFDSTLALDDEALSPFLQFDLNVEVLEEK